MNNIKLTIGDTKYDINPQLTLGEYMNMQKNKSSIEDPIKLMEMLTSIPMEDLKKIDQQKAAIIVDKILSKKFTKHEPQVQSTFEFKGTTYGLETDLTKINFGGWVDLETFIALSHHEHLDKITSIFYRPIIGQIGKKYFLEEYDTEEMLERAELFKDLPFEIVSGAQRFFLEFTKQYITSITHSLTTKTKKMKRRKKAVDMMSKILPKYLHGKLVQGFITNK
jgi:hypothetical protein